MSWPVLYCGRRGREKFTAVLSPSKGLIESANDKLPGFAILVPRARIKNQLFFRGHEFSRFWALASRAFVFFKAEKIPTLLIFPEAEQGASPWHCRRGGSSSQCQKPFSAKGFGGSLKQNPFRGHWPRREKGASVAESVLPRGLRPAGP